MIKGTSAKMATLGVLGLVLITLVSAGIAAHPVDSASSVEDSENGSLTIDMSVKVTLTADNQTVTVDPALPSRPPQVAPGLDGPPTDIDGDGLYEDINGNGRGDFDDVVQFFVHFSDPAITDHVSAYDFNTNGRIDYDDLVTLFKEL